MKGEAALLVHAGLDERAKRKKEETMTLDNSEQYTEIQKLIQRANALRKDFATTAAQVDARGEYPAENLQQIGQAGLFRLCIPQEYGGLWDRKMHSNCEVIPEVANLLGAGEGSTGLIFATNSGVLRILFHENSEAPASTRQQVAREVMEEHIILVGSHAETGTNGHVTAQKVDGGIVINGTKTFNTGSEGARYAHVLHRLEGEQGMHSGLVRLDAPGVRLHHDWDNMGQRAATSQTITYRDVFVPDGWHWRFTALTPLFLAGMFLMYAGVSLGIGESGYDAMLSYIRTVKRTLTPGWTDGMTDPLVRKRIGDFSTRLAAAHALLREMSRQVERSDETSNVRQLLVGVLRAHTACMDATLTTTSELFELTGARSTSNHYRLDRFWRNARTFSLQDRMEVNLSWVGGYELTGELQIPGLPQV